MADYINKKEFDKVMLDCIKADKLSDLALSEFNKIASKVSNRYNFRYVADKEDAIHTAMADFVAYWRGWKWKPVFKMILSRNFLDGEILLINVPNMKSLRVVAANNVKSPYHFKIEVKENKTLENLARCVEKHMAENMSCFLHKVTMKITFVDNINEIAEGKPVEGTVTIVSPPDSSPLIKFKDPLTKIEKFVLPPPAFNWSTSVCNNAIIKSLDKMRPKEFRNGRLLNFSEISNYNDIDKDFLI